MAIVQLIFVIVPVKFELLYGIHARWQSTEQILRLYFFQNVLKTLPLQLRLW